MRGNDKKGHPLLGLILGFLGITSALLLAIYTGVIGGGIALILGLAAVIIGARAGRCGRGIPPIIAGVLSIMLGGVMSVISVSAVEILHKRAVETGQAPLVAEYAENPFFGIMGVVLKIPKDEAVVQELMNQIDAMDALDSGAETEAVSEAAAK